MPDYSDDVWSSASHTSAYIGSGLMPLIVLPLLKIQRLCFQLPWDASRHPSDVFDVGTRCSSSCPVCAGAETAAWRQPAAERPPSGCRCERGGRSVRRRHSGRRGDLLPQTRWDRTQTKSIAAEQRSLKHNRTEQFYTATCRSEMIFSAKNTQSSNTS